jgi:peptide/nickel transport system substrate-binding protein
MKAGLTRREVLRRGGVVGAGALGLGWVVAACGGDDEPDAAQTTGTGSGEAEGGGQEVDAITWAITGDIVSFDPAFVYDFNTNIPVTNVVESLVRVTPDGQLEPNLAESWEETDPQTYVYRIRPGVKFHDGSDLTAEDVVFSLNRHRDTELGSYMATFHERVAEVEATGPLEVVVRLSEPDALWQYSAATQAGAIVKQAFAEEQGEKFGTPDGGVVATGPYKFGSWTKGQEIVVERFDDYWNTERPLKVGRLVVKIIEDESTIVSALGTGEIDGTLALSAKNVQALSAFDTIEVVRSPSYQIHYMTINTQRAPFDDARVRQALSYAIDKAGVLQSVWAGEGEVVRSPVVPALWTYARETFEAAYESLPTYEQDLDRARALIAEAGAEGARASMLVTTSFDEEIALAVQDAGRQIGLDLRPEKVTATDKISREFSGTEDRDYDMSVTQWGSDFPDPSGNLEFPFFSEHTVTNNSAYRNPEVDELVARQRSSTDPEERAQLLTEAQALVVADQPWIVFYTPNTLMPLNKRVSGYELRPLWYWDPWAADLSGT